MSGIGQGEDITNSNKDDNIIVPASENCGLKKIEQPEFSDEIAPKNTLDPEKQNNGSTKVTCLGKPDSNITLNAAEKSVEDLSKENTQSTNMKRVGSPFKAPTNEIEVANLDKSSMGTGRGQDDYEDQMESMKQISLNQISKLDKRVSKDLKIGNQFQEVNYIHTTDQTKSKDIDNEDKMINEDSLQQHKQFIDNNERIEKDIESMHFSEEKHNDNDINTGMKEDTQHIDNHDNCPKTDSVLRTMEENNISEEGNDSLDEEMELRWDDDDDEQISSNDGVVNDVNSKKKENIEMSNIELETDVNIDTAIEEKQTSLDKKSVIGMSADIISQTSTHTNIPIGNTSGCINTETSEQNLNIETDECLQIKARDNSNTKIQENPITGPIDSELIVPELINKNDDVSLQDLSMDISIGHIKTDHGLNKPDIMLEIPTQELIYMDQMEDMSLSLDETDTEPNEIKCADVKEISANNYLTEEDSKFLSDNKIDNIHATNLEQPQNMQTDVNMSLEYKEVNLTTDIQDDILTETKKPQIDLKVQSTCLLESSKDYTKIETNSDLITNTENNDYVHATIEKKSSITSTKTTKGMDTKETEVQPSTSSEIMTPDTSDELPEVTDSLGLLAESSRVMEDDEEPDDEEDGDDDDDYDQEDESSNQMTAEYSEDSNAPQFETDITKEQERKDEPMPSDEKNKELQHIECDDNKTVNVTEDSETGRDMDVDKIECKEAGISTDTIGVATEETVPSIDAALNSEKNIQQNESSNQMDIDIETVKLSDTSDNEVDGEAPANNKTTGHILKNLLQKKDSEPEYKKQSPSKAKTLAIAQQKNVVNIVDLEESSEDEIQEVEKEPEPQSETDFKNINLDEVTSVNIPNDIEIMCTSGTGGNTSEIVSKEGEVVISGVPKPPPHKPARLNTSEVTIKTATTHSESTLVIPETMIEDQSHKTDTKDKPKMGLEIFNLDSDDEIEDTTSAEKEVALQSPKNLTALEIEKARQTSKCINFACPSEGKVAYYTADKVTIAYYDASRKRKAMVCETCAEVVAKRMQGLMDGIRDFTPLLDLKMGKPSQELVEISDSESEDEGDSPEATKETIGEKGAKLLEENLAALINETWLKYNMDTRLNDAQDRIRSELEQMEKDSKDIDKLLNECQIATDKVRTDLYATFEHMRQELPAIVFVDTPNCIYSGLEDDENSNVPDNRVPKRRLSSSSDTASKKPAIPLGYTPLDSEPSPQPPEGPKPDVLPSEAKIDDDKDIAVVKLSAEAAPADLPPAGEVSRAPLRVGMQVYAMRIAFRSWQKGKILELQPKGTGTGQFTMCRVKFEQRMKNSCKVLSARSIAYLEPPDARMTVGTRVIALFKNSGNTGRKESYYSGVIAENPNPVNNYRYLIFFDDGYAQYVQHAHTRLVCECSALVWEEVHPFIREFVRQYLLAYPERPMVRLHAGQSLKTEWNGNWWVSKVLRVDASLAHVHFEEDNRTEWIYRGSTRLKPLYLELQAAERHRARPLPRSTAKRDTVNNMPYVEYTRLDEQSGNKETEAQTQQLQNEEIRRQRSVAKKSTAASQPAPAPPPPLGPPDGVTSRVVYYTPKNAVKPYKMTPHTCGPKCKRSDVLTLKELRTYNPLAKPLLSGWERQIVRHKGQKEVMYRTPCGRRVRNMAELHRYLRALKSDMPVDLFDFHPNTHCLAEFVLNKCLVGKKDLSHGKENVPVPCVNYYDDSLPEFCSYNTERTPTAGVPLNLDPEFLCGCDCTDDCEDKSKCACWKMTLEGARTIGFEGPNIGYVYKRLPEPLPSGIYECNSRCKCKQTCLNRVAQHPLQLKLQVFKTLNRGWGIRALNDIPKGAFLCVYAGNLLTDATANLDGLNEGDEYLAELDYIEVVEQMKEGYEDDIPESDKKLDKKESGQDSSEESDEESSDDNKSNSRHDKEDDDFMPGFISHGVVEFSKRLRKRSKAKKDKEDVETKEKEKEKDIQKDAAGEECITISDDEEVREPSRFTAQAGMGANQFVSKYRSVRCHFGKDEACYIMDAKVQGNIGRYLNHSCCPNVFVQNVFVDTHDPRFPWVAFFALSHVRAGTELTWNYNYDVGSVPGKVLYCFCGAPNCRGRLL